MERLSDAEIEQHLQGVSGWELLDGTAIARELELPDFAAAVAFVVAVADAAEEQGHHPDILIHGYNHVRLTLSTHSQGGLTEADFKLAGRLDQLA